MQYASLFNVGIRLQYGYLNSTYYIVDFFYEICKTKRMSIRNIGTLIRYREWFYESHPKMCSLPNSMYNVWTEHNIQLICDKIL